MTKESENHENGRDNKNNEMKDNASKTYLKDTENEEINERRIDEWMIRPCIIYKEEYKDCCSIKARFNQYFIFGEFIDCSQWKQDFENCNKWVDHKDETARQEIIKSETNRRYVRMRAHYGNNIWKKREKPPEDWNKPLPEWMQNRIRNSYLDLRSQELKTGKVTSEQTLCTIL